MAHDDESVCHVCVNKRRSTARSRQRAQLNYSPLEMRFQRSDQLCAHHDKTAERCHLNDDFAIVTQDYLVRLEPRSKQMSKQTNKQFASMKMTGVYRSNLLIRICSHSFSQNYVNKRGFEIISIFIMNEVFIMYDTDDHTENYIFLIL